MVRHSALHISIIRALGEKHEIAQMLSVSHKTLYPTRPVGPLVAKEDIKFEATGPIIRPHTGFAEDGCRGTSRRSKTVQSISEYRAIDKEICVLNVLQPYVKALMYLWHVILSLWD